MRRENYHAFREWFGPFGTVGVVCIRLAAGPSGDGVLQVIEYFDVYIVSGTVECQQLAQSVFIVIFVGQFQNRLFDTLAQPYDGAADQFVVPFAVGYQPRTLDPGKMRSRCQVYADIGIVVHLQIGSGQCVAHFVFHRFLDDVGFVVSPCQQIDFAGGHNSRHTHRDGAGGEIVYSQIVCGFSTRG